MCLRVLFILFILCCIKSSTSANVIDSLRAMYYSSHDVQIKKNSLAGLCENFRMMPLDSFRLYVQLLNNVAMNSKDDGDRLLSNLYKGFECLKLGQSDSFLFYYKQSEKKLPSYPAIQTKFVTAYGHYFVKKNQHQDAFEQFYKALKLADAQKDTLYIINSKLGIGWANMEMNQIEKAITWFKEALNTTNTKRFQINYPTIFTNMASCYGAIGEFDSSYVYCNKALELSKVNHDLSSQANANFILGNLLMISKKNKEAEDVFLEGYRIHQEIGDPFFIVSDMAQLSIHFANTNQYEKGIDMAEQAIEYAQQHKLHAKLPMCYDALATNYRFSGQYKLYGETMAKMNVLKDSVYKRTSELAVAEMNTKYETEKKEKIIQQQQFEITKRNYFLYGGLGLVVLISLLAFLLYRNHTHKHEKYLQQELIKQQDMASEAVIEAEENERKRIAADLHDGIGQMLTAVKLNLEGLTDRISISNKDDKKVYEKVILMLEESCREVRNVSHNIMPNALIKSGLGHAVKDFIEKVNSERLNIQLSITGIHEKLSSNVEIVVYRVIQECVNNVIKHAQANKLDISIIKDSDGLNVTIEDNGRGFNVSNLENSKGIGMKNIRTRIEYLKGSVDIDSKPGKGTLIAFYIPV